MCLNGNSVISDFSYERIVKWDSLCFKISKQLFLVANEMLSLSRIRARSLRVRRDSYSPRIKA